jgi:hypothetical protein
VFGNRVLRRIFGPKRDEVTGDWTKLHNEELRDLYSSQSIIRILKSRRIRWVGHVARIGRKGTRIGYWWESQREIDHWENQYVCGWIILGWGEVGWGDVEWIGLAQDRTGWLSHRISTSPLTTSCEFGTEPSGFMKRRETIDWPNNWWPLE